MKKLILLFLFVLFLMTNLYCEYWNQFDYSKLSKSEKLELREKHIQNQKKADEFNKINGTDWKITWHGNKEFMKGASMRIKDKITYDSLNVVSFAEEKLSDFLPFLGISKKNLIISTIDIDSERDYFLIIYNQHLNSIQFENIGKISVSYRNGLLRIYSSCFPNFNIDTTQRVTVNEAWKIVKSDFGDAINNFWKKPDSTQVQIIREYDDGSVLMSIPVTELIKTEQDYINKIILTLYQKQIRTKEGKTIYHDIKLTYKISVDFWIYYIDAFNGEVVDKCKNFMG